MKHFTGYDIKDFWESTGCSEGVILMRVMQCLRNNRVPPEWWPPPIWPSSIQNKKKGKG